MTFDISKCKPFDLERALAGDKVVNKAGDEVLQVLVADKVTDGKRVIAVLDGDVSVHLDNGNYNHSHESDYDLLMAPKEPVVTRKYFETGKDFKNKAFILECEPDLEQWYMYIEYHDGEPVNAVFAKDVK